MGVGSGHPPSNDAPERNVSDSEYPELLDQMADQGIVWYEADLTGGSVTYYTKSPGSESETGDSEKLPVSSLTIAAALDRDLLRLAWAENDYVTFLTEIARAGARGYRVDVAARTITYLGHQETYSETVPSSD